MGRLLGRCETAFRYLPWKCKVMHSGNPDISHLSKTQPSQAFGYFFTSLLLGVVVLWVRVSPSGQQVA